MYSDETGTAYLTRDNDNRLWLGTELFGPFTLSNYKHWKLVLGVLEDNLKARGYNELFAAVSSQQNYRWTKFMGFKTMKIVFGNSIEIVRKDL